MTTIAQRLPKNTMIQTTMNDLTIRMTLRTVDEALALKEVVNLFVIPLMELTERDRGRHTAEPWPQMPDEAEAF